MEIPKEPKFNLVYQIKTLSNEKVDSDSTYLIAFSRWKTTEIRNSSSELNYEFKSIKTKKTTTKINLIKELNPRVVYLIGYIYGDGGLKDIYRSKIKTNRYEHRIIIADEYQTHLEKVIIPLIKIVFGIRTKLSKAKNKNYYYISFTSKAIYRQLTNLFELNEGPKNKLKVPKIIENEQELRKWFVRGLFDSDGTTKKDPKSKPRIRIKMKEKHIIDQTKLILQNDFGISFTGPYTDTGDEWYIQCSKKAAILCYKENLFIHSVKKDRLKNQVLEIFKKNQNKQKWDGLVVQPEV